MTSFLYGHCRSSFRTRVVIPQCAVAWEDGLGTWSLKMPVQTLTPSPRASPEQQCAHWGFLRLK